MPPIYTKQFQVQSSETDAFRRLKPSHILAYLQEAAGDHSALLGTGREELALRNLFWAVLRHRVQIARLPLAGETVTVETWPMPTTRTAYPRSTVAYDAQGQELFRGISLWVLMDKDQRSMVLPGKSGVEVEGLLRGSELAVPGGLAPRSMQRKAERIARYTDLDLNGHMNNCRYLDWVADLLPSEFHKMHGVREFSVRYLSEIREDEKIALFWELNDAGHLTVDAQRQTENEGGQPSRAFAVEMAF